MAKNISIDRAKRLREEPHKGHNRWHPDIEPVIEVEPMEEVVIETRDASDGQIRPGVGAPELAKMDLGVVHPLTGPVYVKGAKPGDLLEIEYLDILPTRHAWTRFAPGGGFLPDLLPHHFVVHWDLTPEFATSPSLPGGADSERGVHGHRGGGAVAGAGPRLDGAGGGAEGARGAGVSARRRGRGAAERRGGEGGAAHDPAARELRQRGREASPRDRSSSCRSTSRGRCIRWATRTSRRATRNAAARRSRWARCAWCAGVHRGAAARRRIVWPRFAHPGYFAPPEAAMPRNFIATMGMPVRPDGRNEGADITLAARNAVINMIDLLQERGWSKEQAYVLCSVAVDLKVSNVVDVPNVVVSAVLPEEIFTASR